MYNSQKFKWLGLMPGTERFVLQQGPFPDFEVSSLTPEQRAIFLGTIATVADNGSRMRTLYVWESDADRHTYIYNDSGQILASYAPPEDYDPYVLSREQIESAGNLSEERIQWLIKSLDPTRLVVCATVADGPVPIAPPPLEPEISAGAPLPGGLGILEGGEGEPAVSVTTLSQEPGYDWVLHLNSPGIDSWIPVWRSDDESLPTSGWGTEETTTISTAPDSISKDISDEDSSDLRLRYYFTPYLDTTYVQAPGTESVTVKYVTARNILQETTVTAHVWRPGEWEGGASKAATRTSLGSGVLVYEATVVDEDFQDWDPEHPELDGVLPDTEYRYMFEWTQGGETFRTSVPSTRTWPNPEDIGDFSFIVYGDNRGGDDHNFQALHRDVACLGILGSPRPEGGGATLAFALHSGDLVNAGGDPLQWIPHFFRPAGALVSRVPVFPCVGNHETGGGDGTVSKYRTLFNLPDVGPPNPNDAERWYSFDYGRCHFICLDTESAFSYGSDQYRWLCDSKTGDLTQAWKRKVTYGTLDRIFVWLHFPPYSSGPHGTKTQQQDPAEYQKRMDLRAHLVPKFETYKVDVVFSGHEHLYERVLKGGVQYVVTGGGGAPGHNINLAWDYDGIGAQIRQEYYDQNRHDKGDWRHHCVVSVSAEGAVAATVLNEEHNLLDSFQMP